MARKLVLILFFISIIAGILAVDFLEEETFIQDKNDSVEKANSTQTTVVDCRNRTFICQEREIEKRLDGCGSAWRPWQSYSKFNCSFTTENVDSVTLISDAANYVRAPETEQNYETSYFKHTGEDPWDLEFLPSGNALWTNRKGKLRLRFGESVRLIEKLDVVSDGENGLLGLAVDPRFRENNYVYLYYTFNHSNKETLLKDETIFQQRVSRFKLVNNSLKDETELLEIPGSIYHSGGRLEFGPDNKLYITTGEALMEYKAVDPDFLGGKILRINRDGTIPEDNPFNNSPAYSMGHRNPQGIGWQPETNQLYNTEHGPWRYDELNKVDPGENYGWARYKCDEILNTSISAQKGLETPEVYNESIDPVRCWDEWTMAPSGIEFVNETGHPWHGDLFVAGLRGHYIARFNFEDGLMAQEEVFYVSGRSREVSLRLRDVEFFNGSLHVIGDKLGMVEISPNRK
jgi:glucose/arabinose dehydrogenase